MNKSKAVIFDLDDTLYAEHDYVLSGFQAVADWAAKEFGIPPSEIFSELSQLFANGRRTDTFDAWLLQRKIEQEKSTVQQFVHIYHNHEPVISPSPAAKSLLHELMKIGFLLGLVSDGHLSVQQKKLTALQIGSCFDAIVFSDSLGREHWKPSVVPFETVLRQLRVASGDAVYIGDNPMKDFIGPRQLGMKSIRLRLAGGVYESLEPIDKRSAPDYELQDWSEVAQRIAQIFAE